MPEVLKLTKEKLIEIHKNILYPVCRVVTEKAAGTGIIVYSKPTPETKDKSDEDKECESYVVTCHHVIEDCIKFVKRWSSIAKRDITVEDKQPCQVQLFKYSKHSRCEGMTAFEAEIVAWDKDLDLAVLKIKTVDKMKYVTRLYARNTGEEIVLGTPVISCGCSMGHEPFFQFGHLSAKHDKIVGREYWMSDANVIFGNSGGPVYLADTYEYIGNTARVTVVPQWGFGVDVVTWMGFFIPIDTIYQFFDDSFLQFLYDESITSKECAKKRKRKVEEEERKLMIPEKSSRKISEEDE